MDAGPKSGHGLKQARCAVEGIRLETQDPIAALSSRDLSQRAAAARDLSRVGTPDIIPELVRMAQEDKSPAVRLTTAGAAADILSRYRTGPRAAELSMGERRSLLALFRALDPGVNSGLFNMLASLGVPDALSAIAVGLRDPRGGVRVGAAVGLMRLCQSVSVAGDTALESAVVSMLRDKRLKADALAQVARVCGAVGYTTALLPLQALDLSGLHGEEVSTAIALLEEAGQPYRGAWISDGRDAGEVNPDAALPQVFWAIGTIGALEAGEAGWTARADLDPAAARRMYFRRVGEPTPGPAVQLDGRTFYLAPAAEVLDVVERLTDPFGGVWGSADQPDLTVHRVAAELLCDGLPDSAPGLRARALLYGRAGRPVAAEAALQAAMELKRPPADLWYLQAELARADGREDDARAAYGAFVRKERRKKAPGLERATEALGGA